MLICKFFVVHGKVQWVITQDDNGKTQWIVTQNEICLITHNEMYVLSRMVM